MEPDTSRVEAIVNSALKIANGEDRKACVEAACAGDVALRERVEALLRADAELSAVLNRFAAGQAGAAPPAADKAAPAGPRLNRETPIRQAADPVSTDGEPGDDADPPLDFLEPPSRPDALGRLGHYEVLEVLGRGGFGIVLRAFDEKLQRVVAIKIMSAEIAATSPRKRFLREARASAAVRHEHVVQIYAVEGEPIPYLVMEYIPGHTLEQELDTSGPLEATEMLRLAVQISRGLAAAHAQGLIHRDIKPSNILLEKGLETRVKITDFGLARAADDASLTQSGLVAGTPMYMAPEQAEGVGIDQRADLFSLGSVFYEMLSGRPPFRAENGMAVLKRVAEDTPRPLRDIIPEIPQWLCDIIARLHAKKPGDRFQSASEVADLLARRLADMPTPDTVPATPQPTARSIAPEPTGEPGGVSTGRPSGRWKWLAAAVVLLPIVALGVTEIAGLTHLFRDQAPTPIPITTPSPPPLAVAPFGEDAAKTYQDAWASHLGARVEIDNSIGMKLRLIPPGEFDMGMSPAEIQEVSRTKGTSWGVHAPYAGPVQRVSIKAPFYLGSSEVTVGQFRQFVEAKGYKTQAEADGLGGVHWAGGKTERRPEWIWSSPPFPQTDDHPVVHVSWDDAVAFCDWLSAKERRQYALPSEEQWEWACRAGSAGAWCFGADGALVREYGNVRTLKSTEAVARRKANAFGLFDLHGNALEWCRDSWVPHRAEPDRASLEHPARADHFVQRGGSFVMHEIASRAAFRAGQVHTQNGSAEGFRIALVGAAGSEKNSK